jgi:MFS transporter, AAHS family, 4-hydroxybenzoate transporter
MALFALGSVFGSSLVGFMMSRFAGILPAALVGSALTLAGVGYVSQSVILAIMVLGLAGFFVGIARSGLLALAPLFYSTAIRSTGVGWAMGLGRLGSFVGPLVIGLLVSRDGGSAIAFSQSGHRASAPLCSRLIRISTYEQPFRVPLNRRITIRKDHKDRRFSTEGNEG